ncbi:MAG: SPASM domain-containing protein, partial [Candidatus Hydrogenedentes bacterium]|nr:SPASM domain-containing protein [Candidatus Hydrogenedentota bacterium]
AAFLRHNTVAKMRNACSIYTQFLLKRTVLKGYPVEIIIDPINVCNFRCPLCVTGQRLNSRPAGRMPFDQFTRILDELAPWLYKLRFYSWGEPLLHEDIYRMIGYATSKNVATEMSSNFSNFRPDDADTLIESGLELLIVSLDGATAETYAQYRQGGDFEKVLDNVRALTAAKRRKGSRFPTVEIQCLAMKHNEHELDDMDRLIVELGADRLRIPPVVVNTLDKEQVERWLPVNEKLSRYDYRTMADKIFDGRSRCAWLWRSAVINWDGTVSPCCVFEGPKTDMGSLANSSFMDVWNSETYRSARELFRSGGSAASVRTICTKCKGSPHAADRKQQGLY